MMTQIVTYYVIVSYITVPAVIFLAVRIGTAAYGKDYWSQSKIERLCADFGKPNERDKVAFGAMWLISPVTATIVITRAVAYLAGCVMSGRLK